ncbi:Hsp20/alpha crystallin family protein [Methylonatrum kenyense]|uniref:Hsp20/alpha crystallin family protein n=1 Tax=Methylonatrum kenyense TaxID=455253 RepID=UPI0020BDE3B5|nr:Hsp20/alpha crystallin family protein [Methylonatrum kenyense]MCK8515359.1 Hsp20/alpha crystallin family protein [Methylonatrum kenyense]
MSEVQRVENRELQPERAANQAAEQGWRDRAIVPPVDIFEQDDAVTILADMPGVTPESLGVEVKDHTLSIEGEIAVQMPEGVSARYADLRGSRYARYFTLGDEIDTDGIEGTIHHGVLNVRLPKRDTHRKRRIEIQAT